MLARFGTHKWHLEVSAVKRNNFHGRDFSAQAPSHLQEEDESVVSREGERGGCESSNPTLSPRTIVTDSRCNRSVLKAVWSDDRTGAVPESHISHFPSLCFFLAGKTLLSGSFRSCISNPNKKVAATQSVPRAQLAPPPPANGIQSQQTANPTLTPRRFSPTDTSSSSSAFSD